MRLAFLTPEYVSEPKFDGGLANYLFRLTRVLVQEGHEPEVFVTGVRDETIVHEGVTVHRCAPSQTLTRLHRLQRRAFRRRWFGYMDFLMAAQALARRFRAVHGAHAFDLVEASNFKATGLFVSGGKRPPLVTRISFRSHLSDEAAGRAVDLDARLRYRIEDRSMRRSDAVYGPCSRIAQVSAERIGRSVEVIHPPLFRSVEDTQEDDRLWREELMGIRYVLFFGRICRVKGSDVLARAMRPILREVPDLRLVMVGRGEDATILADVRAELGEQRDKLLHFERQPHAVLFPIIRHAEFVVLPSRVDNLPNTCVEAMLQGQLVVGTRDTGFEDLITDGESGLLARANDSEDLEAVVRKVLCLSPEEVSGIRDNALRRVLGMDPLRAVKELIEFYEGVIRR